MKALVVFYSRTGNTKRVAEAISTGLGCDIEEIFDRKSRNGVIGLIRAGRDARRKALTEIRDITKNTHDYDLILVGTPVWAGNLAPPMRTYISRNKGSFKRVAFFCTMGGDGNPGLFSEMEELAGVNPVATFKVTSKEAKAGSYSENLKSFLGKLRDL